MTTTICPNCKNEYASELGICPYCGYAESVTSRNERPRRSISKPKQSSKRKLSKFIGIIAILWVVIYVILLNMGVLQFPFSITQDQPSVQMESVTSFTPEETEGWMENDGNLESEPESMEES